MKIRVTTNQPTIRRLNGQPECRVGKPLLADAGPSSAVVEQFRCPTVYLATGSEEAPRSMGCATFLSRCGLTRGPRSSKPSTPFLGVQLRYFRMRSAIAR